MAIRAITKKNLSAVEVIVEQDDSLDLENSDYEEYQKTGDVKHLKFLPDTQPTIFLCNFTLTGKDSAKIKDAMAGGYDEDGKPKIALGSWQHQVVKYCLKDIKQPEYLTQEERIKFKKDERGHVHDETISELDRLRIIPSIFAIYSNLNYENHKQAAKN